jgi:hypothetical protein
MTYTPPGFMVHVAGKTFSTTPTPMLQGWGFVFLTSSFFSRTEKIMKTLTNLCFLLLVLFLPQIMNAQKESENLLKNGNFEKFTGDNPDNWDVNNIPGTLTVVSASRISNSGMRAVKIEVKDFFGSVIAGYVCQKNIETAGKSLLIKGSCALQSFGKDQGVIVFCFQNAAGSTVGSDEEYLDDSKGKFVAFTKEIKAPAGSSMLQVRITILPDKSSEKSHPGSYLLCDDLRLTTIEIKEKPLIQ